MALSRSLVTWKRAATSRLATVVLDIEVTPNWSPTTTTGHIFWRWITNSIQGRQRELLSHSERTAVVLKTSPSVKLVCKFRAARKLSMCVGAKKIVWTNLILVK